jgi:dCMP deaminase
MADWHARYLGLAEHVSFWSKDPSTKVGAVIVDQYNSVVSLGYNGFPRGILDSDERLNNRELKYKMVVHGEVNAMSFAQRDLHGYTLYTYPFMPCSVCAGQVIQRGITLVVSPYSDNERWAESFKITRMMLDEAGVKLMEVGAPEWVNARKMKHGKPIGERYASEADYIFWQKEWDSVFNRGKDHGYC